MAPEQGRVSGAKAFQNRLSHGPCAAPDALRLLNLLVFTRSQWKINRK
jgi:hypothetical protein